MMGNCETTSKVTIPIYTFTKYKRFDFVPYKYGCFISSKSRYFNSNTYGYVSLNDTDNGRYIKLENKMIMFVIEQR